MLRRTASAVAILLSLASSGRSAPIDPEALGELDITTFPAERRDEAHKMLGRDASERLKEANRRESAAWAELHSAKDWEAYTKSRIERMRVALNVPDDIATRKPPKVTVARTITGDGWAVDDILFESRPDFWVTANLYRPLNPPKSLPGILLSHSHHAPKTEGELREMGVGWARAGCYVLVPDQLGHGERREHPFNSAADYPKQFRVGRQDYYFRYESSIRLYAAGESLMGWMAYDLSRGVDVLLAQPGIDANRIALLGSVAAGGDVAAVTAALDTRIKAVAPFNFGGPQPETRYPLPEDAEAWFNYAGSGSWESTRNLYRSAADGFLPWVIVGSIAPRTLIYSHEFSWDREHDPVWKRLETIWGWYGATEKLAFAHGRGKLSGQPPEASHCNNIGPIQRKMVAAVLKQTINIPEPDYGKGELPKSQDLLIAGLTGKLQSKMGKPLAASVGSRLEKMNQELAALSPDQQRGRIRAEWRMRMPETAIEDTRATETPASAAAGISISQHILQAEREIRIPVTILEPAATPIARRSAVVMFARAGKQKLLAAGRDEIAKMLDAGVVVVLADLRGFGETSPGSDRDRGSEGSSIAASYLMLGDSLIAGQLRDLRVVMRHVRLLGSVDRSRIAIWGDSVTPPNPPDVAAFVPQDLDQPTPAEPSAAIVALLGGLFEDAAAVYTRGGVVRYRDLVEKSASHVPLESIVPGMGSADDVQASPLSLPIPVRQDASVDIFNRLSKAATDNRSPATWMIEQLKKP